MLQGILIVFCTENYSKLFLKEIRDDMLQSSYCILYRKILEVVP